MLSYQLDQGTRIAVKAIGTLSMIALFIWQVLHISTDVCKDRFGGCKFARHKSEFQNFSLESVNDSGMKGSLAVDKYASKLTSLQEKFQVFPFFASTFSIDSDLPQSSRIPAQCSTQVSPSARNMLGRPFPG